MTESKTLSVSLSKKDYEVLRKRYEELQIRKGSYIKLLFIRGFERYQNGELTLDFSSAAENAIEETEIIGIRVNDDVYEAIKDIALKARISMGRIGAYFVEAEIRKDMVL